jgi:CRP/FNR family transcriptional regulator, cyclic AMP receptor protein
VDFLPILKSTELFSGLTEEELSAICGVCRNVHYSAGQIIFEEDADSTELYILSEGRVAIEIRIVQDTVTEQIHQVRDREVFGELTLIDGHKRSARTRALDDLDLVSIDRADLRRLMEANHHLGYVIMSNLSRIVAGKLRDTNIALRNVIMQQKYIFGSFH